MASGPTDVAKAALTPASANSKAHTAHQASLAALSLGALGVVFGDIGTSPLYTMKECLLAADAGEAQVDDLLGILSLMFWSLIMVVTVKYLCFIMRADHNGRSRLLRGRRTTPRDNRASDIVLHRHRIGV